MHVHWYDRDGNEVDIEQAERLLAGDRHVGFAEIGNVQVSTVHLVLDHRMPLSEGDGAGPPLIFETAIFGSKEFPDEIYGRAPTEAAALAMHDQAVAEVREAARRQ